MGGRQTGSVSGSFEKCHIHKELSLRELVVWATVNILLVV